MSYGHLSSPGARALVALILLVPAVALAHTRFLMSEPAPDDSLAASPQAVRLWFSHPVEADFSRIEVTDGSGQRVDNKDVTRDADDPKALRVTLPALSSGKYQVNWTAVSADGHRVKGTFSFSVQ
jgi:methionine-rich copper-binding protein CopC